MAIVPMQKLFMAGLLQERDIILERLQQLGTVQIEEFAAEAYPHAELFLQPEDSRQAMRQLDERLSVLQAAVLALRPFNSRKKSIFAGKKSISEQRWNELKTEAESIFNRAQEMLHCAETIRGMQEEEQGLLRQIRQLEPYRQYRLPPGQHETRYTCLLLGSVSLSDESLKEANNEPPAVFDVLEQDENHAYISVVCLKADREAVLSLPQMRSFRPLTGFDGDKTVRQALLDRQKELEQVKAARQERQSALVEQAGCLTEFEELYDYMLSQREKKAAEQRLADSRTAFFLQGWIPRNKVGDLRRGLTETVTAVVVETEAPTRDDEPPVLLHNNRFVTPFEAVTELYSLPSPRELDPTPVMAIFYFVFFGMMLSDAGYGIVLAAVCGLLLLRGHFQGTTAKLIKMIFLGSLSTIFWGVMFGGWFGDLLSGLPFFAPVWFNPLENPMKLLIWSFVFGAVHLMAGMAMQARLLIRSGHVWDALWDVGLWYVLFGGLLLWFLGYGASVALVGAAGLVLTQGRREQGWLKRLGVGLLSLYDITGYVSDILSYSRLLALGLATGVIGQVVNTMAGLGGSGALGIIMLILILPLGHGFNIAINTLGAYVHAARLQYVEFFGKFYSGGGRAFLPLRRKTRYTAQ